MPSQVFSGKSVRKTSARGKRRRSEGFARPEGWSSHSQRMQAVWVELKLEELGWKKIIDSRGRVGIMPAPLLGEPSQRGALEGRARREEKEGRLQALKVPVRTKAGSLGMEAVVAGG